MFDRDSRVYALYRLSHGPGGPESLLEALRSATTAPGQEPGCRSSQIWRDADDSARVLLLEEWDTPQDLERHVRTPVFRRLLAVLELSAGNPEVTYIQAGRLKGLEWIEDVVGSGSNLDQGPSEQNRASKRHGR